MRYILLLGIALAPLLVSSLTCTENDSPVPIREMGIAGNGVTLHMRIAGDPESGNVLIANHGGPGLCSHYMASLEQLAGEDFAVVTYDQRGTCRSSTPSNGYDMLNYIADLEAVRASVGIEKVHLLGHSWGGLVAMIYAAVHPEHVRSIVLASSGPPSWQAVQAGYEYRAQRIAALQQQGLIPQIITALEDILPAYFSDPAFELPDELKEMHYNPAVEQQTFTTLGDYDFTAEVATIIHPVLLLWGQDDPFGLSTGQAAASALSSAKVEFVLLKECGHFWQECPDEFFSRIRE
ncbi:MAG: alpha/beta fold hydrolase, partial [Candidatus Neomarinimicrobiota bacterium]